MDSSTEIRRSVIVAAGQEKVWRVMTDPQHFTKWFGSPVHFERLAVGESILFGEEEESDRGTIALVEAPEQFAFRWTPEPGYPVETLVTFHLESVAEGTRVTVTETGFEGLPPEVRQSRFDLNQKGWNMLLDEFGSYLQTVDDV